MTMPTLMFRFPGGRYHATPWGHHVNEGLVEWPPSPWRVLRALISVGFTARGWLELPPAGRRLIETLAGALPRYRLPRAGLAQSHHYMPLASLDGGRERTTLVYDTWARVGGEVLAITWDVALGTEARQLLASLAADLSYLGRSESWVEARLLEPGEPLPDGLDAWAADGDLPAGPGWEQIALLAPELPERYADWRRRALETVSGPPPLREGGRKPGAKRLRERQRVEASYPEDVPACLQVDSSWLQRLGWSQPPGSRRVLYWRRSDALEVGPPRAQPLIREAAPVEAMLLALSTPTGNRHALPVRFRALPQAELIHRALVDLLVRSGDVRAAPALVGLDEHDRPLRGHRHAHILPLDLDGDGHLDHVLIWAPMGLGSAAQAAIRALRRTYTKGGGSDLRVAVAGAGTLETLRDLPGRAREVMARLLAPDGGARCWESLTPFVPPRHLKPRGANALRGQVLAELESRGLPGAIVEPMADAVVREAALRHFVRVRGRRGRPPPIDVSFGVRLSFDRPVPGPISLGYGSHFGLGLFQAVPDRI